MAIVNLHLGNRKKFQKSQVKLIVAIAHKIPLTNQLAKALHRITCYEIKISTLFWNRQITNFSSSLAMEFKINSALGILLLRLHDVSKPAVREIAVVRCDKSSILRSCFLCFGFARNRLKTMSSLVCKTPIWLTWPIHNDVNCMFCIIFVMNTLSQAVFLHTSIIHLDIMLTINLQFIVQL